MIKKIKRRSKEPNLKHIDAKVSNALWVKKKDLTRAELDAVLDKTFIRGKEKYDKTGDHELQTVIEKGSYLGLPRGFFHDHFTQSIAVTNQKIKWPEFQFPEGMSWRTGQEDSVQAMLAYFKGKEYGQCRLEAAVGTGKTCLSLYVASKLKMRTLVLVHKEDLALAFCKEAKRFIPGVRFGHCQADSWVYKNCHVVTATFQTLYSRENKLPKDFLSRFGLVIIDEGHRCPAETFEGVLKRFTAAYRLGVSATWRRRDGLDNVFRAHLGDIVHTANSKSMSATFTRPALPFSPRIINPKLWAYVVNGIAEHTGYRKWIAEQVVKAVLNGGRTPLVVADRVEMLKDLEERINQLFVDNGYRTKKAMLFIGASTTAEKKRVMKNADVVVASASMWREGSNLPRLDMLFLCTPSSDIEQIVGRIQRILPGKKTPLVVDPQLSCANPMVRSSAYARLIQYKKLGFKEIVKE